MTGRSKFPRDAQSVPQGTQLNNMFEIDQLVSAGGMGEVYRGHNIQTQDLVAIKIVLPEFAEDELILELFRKEARILNHLHHEAIVRYYVFSIDAALGLPFLAMEFVDGPSLAERIKSGPLDTVSVVTLQRNLADGLEKAHQAGVIHRDIAPDNIILPDGRVDRAKIIDFGIARSAAAGGGTLLGGQFAGKYNFVSPEQLGLFDGDVTNRSDIYSLGLVLAACVLGRPLDMSGSQVAVIEKRRVVPDLTGIDPPLRDLIEAMLQPDPQHRPQTMAEVADWPTFDDPDLEFEKTRLYTSPPSRHPSRPPARHPSRPPTRLPSRAPTKHPSRAPSRPPASQPTGYPTGYPTGHATGYPSHPPEQAEREVTRPPTWHPPPAATPDPPDLTDPHRPPTWHPSQPPLEPLQVGSPPPAPSRPELSARPVDRRRDKPRSNAGRIAASVAAAAILVAGVGGWAYVEYWSGAWYQDQARVVPMAAEPGPPLPGAEIVATPEPPEPLFTAEEVRDYVNSFDGGHCFFAFPVNASQRQAEVIGYANRRQPFDALQDAFQERFGFEAAIEMRNVTDDQCIVVEALDRFSSKGAGRVGLDLSQGVVRSGRSLSGTVSGLGERHLGLVMLDNFGFVHNLQSYVTGEGDAVSFEIEEMSTASPMDFQPQLVLSVASAEPLQALDLQASVPASELLPSLLDEIASKPEGLATAVGYFMFGS